MADIVVKENGASNVRHSLRNSEYIVADVGVKSKNPSTDAGI
jgi:hypothetical protein